jgi:hypothetical protein
VNAYDPKNAYTIGALLRYVQHKYDCDWLQPMWHKGPCDCGLTALIQQLPEDLLKLLVETNDHVRATVEEIKQREERAEREAREAVAQRFQQEPK